MRGLRALTPARSARVALLVTAARYDPRTGQLLVAKAHEPQGHVWSDHRLYDRRQLIERLQAGERLAVGEPGDLANDFVIGGFLRLEPGEDGPRLLADGRSGSTDDLGVPHF